MKLYPFLILALLSGCVTTSIQTVNLNDTPPDQAVTLTSELTASTQKLIGDLFPFEREWSTPFIAKDKPAMYVVLSKVDGVRGTTSRHFDPNGSYNSAWNGEFEVRTSPGVKTLQITPSSTKYAPNETRQIEFSAHPAKRYLVAALKRRENKGSIQVIHWAPLVIDLTTKDLVIPDGEPEWSTYCISSSEFGGPRPCP